MGYWRDRAKSLGESLTMEREYSRGLLKAIDRELALS